MDRIEYMLLILSGLAISVSLMIMFIIWLSAYFADKMSDK